MMFQLTELNSREGFLFRDNTENDIAESYVV